MSSEINFEWLDVEDIVWDIFDKNQSKWGHNFTDCKNKVISLKKAKELTVLFRGSHESIELNEIIDMKIKCLIRDYIMPVTHRIKTEERSKNLNMALYIAHSELCHLITSYDIFPNSEEIIDELKIQCKRLESGTKTNPIISEGEIKINS